MFTRIPYDLYALDAHDLTYHCLARYRSLLTASSTPTETKILIRRLIPILEGFLPTKEVG